ncbi:MAG TPA: peptidylprolyl isomerase [Candidatus Baltobacteraceae bacterium]|nr:peptidylprolyl isomerase [Candidatus Baltobacteraceae bacterium]
MSKAQRIIAGLATLLLGTSLAACSGGGSVATVNGQPISRAAFEDKLEASPVARNTLQQMVQETLIEQYAKNNNITVTDAEIDKRESDLKANFPNGSWDEMLKARGLSEADVKSALREQIILDKALAKDVTITPAQIKQYFDKNHAAFDKPEQVRARHILVPDLATANKIEAQLKAGKNFADLAKQYSTDPGSKDKGGELGWFRRGQMVPAFDKVAFSLPVGAISPPVKSPFGYHIIQVEAKQPGQQATLANSSARIADMLRQQQEAPLIQPFLQGLQQKATITVSDPRFADLFPSPPPSAPTPATTAAAPAPTTAPSTAPTK